MKRRRPDWTGLTGKIIDLAGEHPRTKSPARAGLKSRRNVGSSEPTGSEFAAKDVGIRTARAFPLRSARVMIRENDGGSRLANSDSSAGLALASQRHLFEIPDDVAFLNCAYISPLPNASLIAGDRGLRRKAQPWTIAAADFFTSSETVRKLFADLINADADDVAFAPAVSYGMAQAAHNIPIRRTQRIVTLSEQFPSNVYPWMDLAERTRAAFVSVPRPGDDDWTSALLSFIDASTGVVAVPQCHWIDGGLIDLEAIAAACRRVGAALCVDATQSVGALPFDVKRIDPDFVAAASYKWLLGPYSLGFLYVAPRWQRGRPIEHNWIAREGSEDFAGLVNYRHDFQSGARRFDVGERSNFALMPGP